MPRTKESEPQPKAKAQPKRIPATKKAADDVIAKPKRLTPKQKNEALKQKLQDLLNEM